MDLALDALIQVPAGQQWGKTNVTLSVKSAEDRNRERCGPN